MEAADVPIVMFGCPKRARSPESGLSDYLVVKEGPTSSTATTKGRPRAATTFRAQISASPPFRRVP